MPFKHILVCLVFLTRLPVGKSLSAEDFQLHKAAWAFPLAGLVVGVAGGLVLWAAAAIHLPPLVGALLALGAMALLTGALHEDGFADIADGFGGGTTPERKREIMKDSRVGAYGVVAVVLSLGLRAAALAALPMDIAPLALAAVIAASRAAPVAIMALGTPVGEGLAKWAGRPAGGILVLCLVLAILPGVLLPGWNVLISITTALAIAAVGTWLLARRQIGGYTGDVLGASVQVTEICALLALAALIGEGNT